MRCAGRLWAGGFLVHIFEPVLAEKLNRMRRADGPISAAEVIGGAIFFAAPADPLRMFGMEGNRRHFCLLLSAKTTSGCHFRAHGLALGFVEERRGEWEDFVFLHRDVTNVEIHEFVD